MSLEMSLYRISVLLFGMLVAFSLLGIVLMLLIGDICKYLSVLANELRKR